MYWKYQKYQTKISNIFDIWILISDIFPTVSTNVACVVALDEVGSVSDNQLRQGQFVELIRCITKHLTDGEEQLQAFVEFLNDSLDKSHEEKIRGLVSFLQHFVHVSYQLKLCRCGSKVHYWNAKCRVWEALITRNHFNDEVPFGIIANSETCQKNLKTFRPPNWFVGHR